MRGRSGCHSAACLASLSSKSTLVSFESQPVNGLGQSFLLRDIGIGAACNGSHNHSLDAVMEAVLECVSIFNIDCDNCGLTVGSE